MINPIWLRSFCSLVDIGHFTQTADRLHMTQSGVSQHIRKLEDQVGQMLLLRQGKGFTLTEAGRKLYDEGQKILLALEQLDRDLGNDPEHAGLVKVASPGSVGLRLYPYFLEIQQTFPGLTLDHRFASNNGIEEVIDNHEADLGLMTRPSTNPSLQNELVGHEALLLITPENTQNTSWENLKRLGFIGHPDAAHQANLLLAENFPDFRHIDQFRLKGFSNQIGLILDPVARGLGFTVLPAFAVAAYKDQKAIKAHHLHNPVSEPIYLCRHARRPPPRRVEFIADRIREILQPEI